MSDQVDAGWRPTPAPAPAQSRQFLLVFLALTLLGLGAMAAGHVALARRGLLVEPPLTATSCIDEKFAAMRTAPLSDRTMLAVGSSATWRNLDTALLEQALPGTKPYNAAPCYLHVDQAAFLTEFLLERAPRVTTVFAVLAPRDFEGCPAEETEFFDPALVSAFLSRSVPKWLPYVSGFRLPYLLREARNLRSRRASGRRDPADTAAYDALGSSILTQTQEWSPPLRIDPTCFAGLARLERAATRAGARLVVATLPVMPRWAEANDPTGAEMESWTRQIAETLHLDDSQLIDGRALRWGNERFADPVHVLYPFHTDLTRFYADAMLARNGGVAAGAAGPRPGAGG